jgi:DNA-binding NarL/FixJ family response regulator
MPADGYLRKLAQSDCNCMLLSRGVSVCRLRVVIADDNPEFLSELVAILGADFDIVAKAADGQSALDCICKFRPDVAVVDLKMPELNGIDLLRQIKRCKAESRIIICSVNADREVIDHTLAIGACGYVFKSQIAQDLVRAVRAVASGQKFVSQG